MIMVTRCIHQVHSLASDRSNSRRVWAAIHRGLCWKAQDSAACLQIREPWSRISARARHEGRGRRQGGIRRGWGGNHGSGGHCRSPCKGRLRAG